MPRETIILDLLTGDPQGLRTAAFQQSWTGKAFATPRTELKDLLNMSEMQKAGIYILAGREAALDENKALAYIGVGKSIRNRLKNRKEDFWSQAFVFVDVAAGLHEGQIKHLEGELITEAREVDRFKIKNDQDSGGPLPDHEIAGMSFFLSKVRIILPVLGCDLLVPKAYASKNAKLTCKIKTLAASGNRSSKGFVVFKGSQAILKPRRNTLETQNWVFQLREKLLKAKILRKESDNLVFSQDYEFSSPSAAAAVIRGGTANGLTSWRDSEGKMLRDIEAEI